MHAISTYSPIFIVLWLNIKFAIEFSREVVSWNYYVNFIVYFLIFEVSQFHETGVQKGVFGGYGD